MFHPSTGVVVSGILKEATAESHASTEKKLMLFLKGINSNEEYATLLQALYGYYAPLEHLIEKFIKQSHLPDLAQRRKASLILEDLNALGIDSIPPSSTFLPQIADESEAWGALYVLEGSTLGGKYIAAMLSKKSIGADALRFFEGYGNNGEQRWQDFKEALDERARHLPVNEIIDAAENTFVQLRNWIDKSLC